MDIIYHKIKENYGYAKPYKESLHTHTLSLSRRNFCLFKGLKANPNRKSQRGGIMPRIILAMFTFILCLSWAEVKVEKVLETTSIKEYNQWVKKNKAKYPGLNFIYVNAELEEKTKEGRRYKIHYYDENGNKKHTEEVKGNIDVIVSPYMDAVGIYTCAPYRPADAVIKNEKGETILITHGFLAFVSPYLYLTIPEDGECSPPNPTVKVFHAKQRQWTDTLEDCWLLNGRDVAHSYNFKFSIVSICKNTNCDSLQLILLDSTGREKWRKPYFIMPGQIGLVTVAIAPDASYIVAGKGDKVDVYDFNGVLQKEYPLPSPPPAQCGISEKGKYLVVVTRNTITKYDNETQREIWHKEIMEGAPKRVVLSKNGDYALIQFHPNIIYLLDKNGDILKQCSLETEIHHPTAPGGKEITVIHPVEARLEFHDDIVVIFYEIEGKIYAKIWRIKE